MTFLSQNQDLFIGENYTRGMLCDFMDIKYVNDEIERGLYKPSKFSSVIVFSTLENRLGYVNIKFSDEIFLYSGNWAKQNELLVQHRETGNELLLFIRKDENTGFYYFGKCLFEGEYKLEKYTLPLFGLLLLETKFSKHKFISIPEA